MRGRKLFVGNLTYNTTVSQLANLFSVYGEVETAKIIADKGYGFVMMKSDSDAERAKSALHGSLHEGNILVVDYARGSD